MGSYGLGASLSVLGLLQGVLGRGGDVVCIYDEIKTFCHVGLFDPIPSGPDFIAVLNSKQIFTLIL